MLPLSVLSRRALVATGLLAAAPHAAVAKKKKKKKPPPPLAFAAMAVSAVGAGAGAATFEWKFAGRVAHPASGVAPGLSGAVLVDVGATADQTRAEIVADVRAIAAFSLLGQGQDVPEDRIAVVLL